MVMFHPVAFDVSFRVQFRVQIVRLTHRLASMPRLKNPALGPLVGVYTHITLICICCSHECCNTC